MELHNIPPRFEHRANEPKKDGPEIRIIPVDDTQFDKIWPIFHEVIKTGDTYVYSPDTPKEEAKVIWFEIPLKTYIAYLQDEVAGTYYIRPNFKGLSSHVANAGFMVYPHFQGKGIGKAMGEHALKEAKVLGFEAMQFNSVVNTNHAAIKLWQSLGFKIIGTIPKAYKHQRFGYVDLLIMHRFL